MKASELRVGNYITKLVGTVYRVEGVLLDNVFTESYSIPALEFNGIAITEEWLLKFGFNKSDSFRKARFEVYKPVDWTGYMFSEGSLILREIKYVHQLQNLYFVLTGEELTVKK